VATGQLAFSSDVRAGHAAALAVDSLAGGPNGQDDGTYWQAAGAASFAANRTWEVKLASAQTVRAVQARLELDGPGWITVDARFLDDTGAQLMRTTIYDGPAVDYQAIGITLATPLPGVRDVYLIFTQSPAGVAPGLRTVGVYTP
jgi:hypothetical protein